jgi:hypothetical protein
MLLGVPREVRLTSAKETFMLDCKAAGFSADTMRRYRDILSGFVNFTGDMLVRELGPDHVRMYIAELTDRAGHYEGEKFSSRSLMKHYVVVRMWVRWMYAQKIITERVTDDGSRLVYRRGFRRSCDSRITQQYLHLANADLFEAHRDASPIDRRQTKSRRRP